MRNKRELWCQGIFEEFQFMAIRHYRWNSWIDIAQFQPLRVRLFLDRSTRWVPGSHDGRM